MMRLFIIFLCTTSLCFAEADTISLFPLNQYDQTISHWIKPSDPNYDERLLSKEVEQKHYQLYLNHYIGESSPWNANYIEHILHQPSGSDLKSIEIAVLTQFNNKNKPNDQIGYGINFRPYEDSWIENIENNMNLTQLDQLTYDANQRGITIANSAARGLPTNDPHFYNYKLAGQGYPFDNLQISAVWANTPVYILATTRDHAWDLVVTPEFIAWIQSINIANVSESFVRTWTTASQKHLAAITKNELSLIDENNHALFETYVGAVFPAEDADFSMRLMVAIPDKHHQALIKHVIVAKENAVMMPFTLTRHHFADIIKNMIGRPYGWGGLHFYNDCSSELKSIFTPFGIWLPRHSSQQVQSGRMVDKTLSSPSDRLTYLMENGHPLVTLVYIGGHVVLYVGNFADEANNRNVVMTYQNIWGLKPNPPNRRAVIGEAVFLPMLLQYPEDPELGSLAARQYFQVSYLDEIPEPNQNPINLQSFILDQLK